MKENLQAKAAENSGRTGCKTGNGGLSELLSPPGETVPRIRQAGGPVIAAGKNDDGARTENETHGNGRQGLFVQ